MATKSREFDENYYYHIYNRGIDKRLTYENARDYQRFLELIDFYRHDQIIRFTKYQEMSERRKLYYAERHPTGDQTRRVELLAYCLMPNHFHLVLKTNQWNGITKFMSDISNSHTKYFNLKYDRSGHLFQGAFKDKEVRTEASLMQVVRYVHLNPVFSMQTNPDKNLDPIEYPFSSYKEWLQIGATHPSGVLVDQTAVEEWLEHMGGAKAYREFIESKVIANKPELGIEDLIIEGSPEPPA